MMVGKKQLKLAIFARIGGEAVRMGMGHLRAAVRKI
jgi:hypothetical protein